MTSDDMLSMVKAVDNAIYIADNGAFNDGDYETSIGEDAMREVDSLKEAVKILAVVLKDMLTAVLEP